MLLEGKAALVTGAGRGIGREVALMLAREGAGVVVNDLGAELKGEGADVTPALEVVRDIERAGGKAIANGDSVSDWDGAHRMVQMALDKFGRLDIVVNVAGILRDKMFHRMTREDWQAVIDVHLNGTFNVSRAAIGPMREAGRGAFIHFTSTSGLIGSMGQANYSAAKMGIVGLSRSIAIEGAAVGVSSNCLAPFAWTRMIESIPVNSPEQQVRVERMRKAMPAEKIAPLVVALGSDEGRQISGNIFAVRGDEIFLMSQPRPIRVGHNGQGWTPQTVVEKLFPAFKPSLHGLEVTNGVFSWDPL